MDILRHFASLVVVLLVAQARAADPLSWPPTTAETRPWAYNWWHGSAVDEQNLAKEIERYRDGGLGGIHIIPIYQAKGAESRSIEYLSPRWMQLLAFARQTTTQAGMGLDMTTGTGWCFGGPQIPRERGGWKLTARTVQVADGGKLEKLDAGALIALRARAADGQEIDLEPLVAPNGSVKWDSAGKAWTVHILAATPGGPAVKRPSPGGAGPMINPFDPEAMRLYLARFTDAFANYKGPLPRSMYHDSFEYNSSWAPALPEAFAKRRGYALVDRVADFCGDPRTSDAAARVRADYKETLSDLMVEEVFPQWIDWCHQRGIRTRNQAHGSPGNLLDLYALADIPETEMFGRGTRDPLVSRFDGRFREGDRNPLISKFASSAAHVAGRQLVSAETGTWMAEHFCETLEELKCLVDLFFASGVNHVIYHGCCYSPDDAEWPGWLFYASTQMNPRNAIWRDAPALNAYITRCQSILQSGAPDNDVLLYWPIHDYWQSEPNLVVGLTVHNDAWLVKQPIGSTAQALWGRGFGFDFISDRQLVASTLAGGRIKTAGSDYAAILVPPSRLMPLPTLKKLVDLARQGGTVVFQDRLPEDVPGAGDLAARREAMKAILGALALKPAGENAREATVGDGRIIVGELESALARAKVAREMLVDHAGALFIRRRHEFGRHYFIANQGTQSMDGWIPLATPAASVIAMDPMTGRTGIATTRRSATGAIEVRLHLPPGHSILLRTLDREVKGQPWHNLIAGDAKLQIKGPWRFRCTSGGPVVPPNHVLLTEGPEPWTRFDTNPEFERFAGTGVYSTSFAAPTGPGPWVLDLGEVYHSARIRLNGKDLGTLIMHPYRVEVTDLREDGNELVIAVTNLSANRIRDLDRRKVPWRIFHDINLVNINYKPFDASNWPIQPSGLLGPVTLRPLEGGAQ